MFCRTDRAIVSNNRMRRRARSMRLIAHVKISAMADSLSRDATNAAWRAGFREAFGASALVLAVGYIGFGSLAQSQGFSLLHAALSTLCIWALPGQLILVETSTLDTPAIVIVLAVAFSASRFLPMTVALMPLLR